MKAWLAEFIQNDRAFKMDRPVWSSFPSCASSAIISFRFSKRLLSASSLERSDSNNVIIFTVLPYLWHSPQFH